jgi:hypothetical protein
MAWLDEQMNVPSLTDQYLMQIAAEVRRVLSKKPKKIKVEHFLLKFVKRGDRMRAKERRIKESDMIWLAAMGIKRPGDDKTEDPS